ncbi:MAG: hypothetical protein MJ211_14660 [Bacteroidales bacterium]|nr:hypothetical protein [Bacteroidales bacterium]
MKNIIIIITLLFTATISYAQNRGYVDTRDHNGWNNERNHNDRRTTPPPPPPDNHHNNRRDVPPPFRHELQWFGINNISFECPASMISLIQNDYYAEFSDSHIFLKVQIEMNSYPNNYMKVDVNNVANANLIHVNGRIKKHISTIDYTGWMIEGEYNHFQNAIAAELSSPHSRKTLKIFIRYDKPLKKEATDILKSFRERR